MTHLPKIREEIPLPNTPEGALFHYTPDEAAQWTPFTHSTLREMVRRREIPFVANGRKTWFRGEQIVEIADRYVVKPFKASAPTDTVRGVSGCQPCPRARVT
ncbi:helix-turn-helix domain-containing protein [Streptomyces sp. NPDC006552]|uniref:helix-turn-helix domain-containing protein n=1 Tax=Streptomyces sp. NPDC006552 TaxID=3157179 RepID=UPI0033B7C687